jgi:PIN domain nuclease of toxin-antitoxin system
MLNLDTHIVVKALVGDLTPREAKLIAGEQCGISPIVMWEIQMLAARGRITVDLDHPQLVEALRRLHTWPLTREICRAISDLDFQGDPADALIAATSVIHNVPLLTRDRTINRSRVVPLAK